MLSSNSEKVNSFIDDIQFQSSEKHKILLSLRQLVKKANSNLVEDIKYGGLVYNLSNELLGGIFVYKNHLSFEFGKGAELDDPDGILEGTGKYRRHIKISKLDEIAAKKVVHFIQQAFVNG